MGGRHARQVSLDAQHFDLRMRLLSQDHDVEGLARVTITNTGDTVLRRLNFYLHPELQMRAIRDSDGKDLRFQVKLISTLFSITGNLLDITISRHLEPGASETLAFEYVGWLNPSGVTAAYQDAYSDSFYGIRPDVVFLRALTSTLWFPSPQYDLGGMNDLASYRLELDIPERFQPLAFGMLVSERVENGRNRSVWETYRPVSLLDPCLFLDRWTVEEAGSFRLYYHENSQSRQAAKIYTEVGEAFLRFFCSHYSAGLEIRDAPVRFAELNLPMGAYVGQNVIGLSQNAFAGILTADQGKRYALFSWLGHEMVHEYIRTQVAMEAKGQAVIWDGFALYFHLPCMWELFGTEFEKWDLLSRWRRYEDGLDTGRNDRGAVPRHVPLADIAIGEEYSTYKDLWLTSDKLQIILHRLQRHIVGDAAFMRAFSEYLGQHRQQPATLNDFRAALEEESGIDLKDFFHRWFYTIERLPEEWKPYELSSVP